jgi:hypothetical protein
MVREIMKCLSGRAISVSNDRLTICVPQKEKRTSEGYQGSQNQATGGDCQRIPDRGPPN